MLNFSARVRRDGVRSLLAVALASVSSLALSAPAQAQTADAAARTARAERAYNIPAQPLSSALIRFAEQSNLQILFSEEAVSGFTSRSVSGRRTPEAALAQMLPPGAPRIEIAGDRIVQVEPPTRPQHAATETAEEIVVTGTRIRGAAPVGANLVTIDRTAIEESGRSTVQDVLGLVSQNFTGGRFETTQQGGPEHNANRSLSSSVNLRGLGPGSTLSLVNGRRLAPAGLGHFVDVSTIPLAAVERVEVLADGASAAYGSDAVGGVVNFILRHDFEGAETSLCFGADGRGDVSEQMFSHVLGRSSDRFSLVAAYEYRDRTGLEWNDRAFASDSNLTRYGGLNYSRPQANPGTITRIGATPVTLAIPRGQDGTSLAASELIVGQVNRQNAVEGQSLLPAQTSHGLFLSGRVELTPRLEIFAEVLAGLRSAAKSLNPPHFYGGRVRSLPCEERSLRNPRDPLSIERLWPHAGATDAADAHAPACVCLRAMPRRPPLTESGANTMIVHLSEWRAGCAERRPSGSEGGRGVSSPKCSRPTLCLSEAFHPRPEDGAIAPIAAHEDWFAGLDIARTLSRDTACYIPSRDVIAMPPVAAFDSAEAYAATLNHEAVHYAEVRIMPHTYDFPPVAVIFW